MFRLLVFLGFDVMFIYILYAYWSEMSAGNILLCLAFAAFFTWEVIRTIKYALE